MTLTQTIAFYALPVGSLLLSLFALTISVRSARRDQERERKRRGETR